MPSTCTHLDTIQEQDPSGDGCLECTRSGSQWVHLRMCQSCGHVGCCDASPNRHATAHHRQTEHPLIRSFEPGEQWYFCYADAAFFELAGAPPAPHHR
jgi:uncharacterized UBP type Zn finger protein